MENTPFTFLHQDFLHKRFYATGTGVNEKEKVSVARFFKTV
jgi:hypothetical protein